MRVRIDEPGDDAGALRIDFIPFEGDRTLELAVVTDPDDISLPGGQCAHLEATERVAATGNHGGERARPPDHEVGPNHIARSMPDSAAKATAVSYPASACRITPMPGSVVSTRSSRCAMPAVPSATTTMPAWIELPMPTPPP